MEDYIVKTINNVEQDEMFRLSVIFFQDYFTLTIFQNTNAWTSNVDSNILQILANQHEKSLKDYGKELKEYFKNTPENVTFGVIKNNFVMFCIPKENLRIKYFTCKLKKIDYNECTQNLIDLMYARYLELEKNFVIMRKEKEELEICKDEYEKMLQEFIQRKKTEEDVLYSNFVLTLNEKKLRIQHLNELLDAFRRGRPTINPPIDVKRRKMKPTENKLPVKKEEVSESDSGGTDNYTTDDETEMEVKDEALKTIETDDINKNTIVDYTEPGTSKQDYDFLNDSPPSHHSLPKRLKRDMMIDDLYFNTSCISKKEHVIDKETSKDSEVCDKAKKAAPVIDFSTQDLLDNL